MLGRALATQPLAQPEASESKLPNRWPGVFISEACEVAVKRRRPEGSLAKGPCCRAQLLHRRAWRPKGNRGWWGWVGLERCEAHGVELEVTQTSQHAHSNRRVPSPKECRPLRLLCRPRCAAHPAVAARHNDFASASLVGFAISLRRNVPGCLRKGLRRWGVPKPRLPGTWRDQRAVCGEFLCRSLAVWAAWMCLWPDNGDLHLGRGIRCGDSAAKWAWIQFWRSSNGAWAFGASASGGGTGLWASTVGRIFAQGFGRRVEPGLSHTVRFSY